MTFEAPKSPIPPARATTRSSAGWWASRARLITKSAAHSPGP